MIGDTLYCKHKQLLLEATLPILTFPPYLQVLVQSQFGEFILEMDSEVHVLN